MVDGTSDEFFHNFVGAAVDFLNPGVGIEFADEVFAHVAIAAMELEAFVHDVALGLAAPPFDHGCFLGSEGAGLEFGEALIEEGGHEFDLGGDFGEFESGVLKIHDTLTEGAALLDIVPGDGQGTLAGTEGGIAEDQSFPGELTHKLVEALAGLAAK